MVKIYFTCLLLRLSGDLVGSHFRVVLQTADGMQMQRSADCQRFSADELAHAALRARRKLGSTVYLATHAPVMWPCVGGAENSHTKAACCHMTGSDKHACTNLKTVSLPWKRVSLGTWKRINVSLAFSSAAGRTSVFWDFSILAMVPWETTSP